MTCERMLGLVGVESRMTCERVLGLLALEARMTCRRCLVVVGAAGADGVRADARLLLALRRGCCASEARMLLALLARMESGRLGCWRFGRGSAGIGEREGVSRVRGTLHYCTEGVEAAGEEGGPGSGTKPTGAGIRCPDGKFTPTRGTLPRGLLPRGSYYSGSRVLSGRANLVSLGRRQPASLDPPLWPVWVCWDWSECPWYHPSGIAN